NAVEFLNHQVEKMLNKLLVEFTKSRPYRTTDNALVEGKNGAVIRKHIGYGVIAAEHDPAEHYRTPYEKFVSLPDWNQYLKSPPSSCSPGDAHERHRGSSANTKSQTHLAGQVPTKWMNAFAGSRQRWAEKGARSPPLSRHLYPGSKTTATKGDSVPLHLPPS